MQDIKTRDPGPHVKQIGEKLSELVEHLRADVTKVDDAKAIALFETSAEVLKGLKKAYEDFQARSEPAWK